MTRPDEEERVTDKPEKDLDLSKETLKDLEAPEEADDDAKGGAADAVRSDNHTSRIPC